jgi:hypothetical protein
VEKLAYQEDIEKIFMNDIREKKRTGTGAFHMRGKGVKHGMNGALRTSSYFMSNKEKKQLDGKVETFNMHTILTLEEFNRKDVETQKMLLTKWREIYTNDKIIEEMGFTNHQKYYDLVSELKVPKKPRTGIPYKERKPRQKIQKAAEAPKEEVKEVQEELKFRLVPKAELIPKAEAVTTTLVTPPTGMVLAYNREYTSEQLSKIFTKLQLIIEGEETKYQVNISITERTFE